MTTHPNFKFILKNRTWTSPPFFFVFHDGKRSEMWFGDKDLSGRITFFEAAKKNNAKTYLQTKAGDIEIFEKDFQ
jgi:hypothetical protein